jgi:DNA-binding IclR family transcriptional regulator
VENYRRNTPLELLAQTHLRRLRDLFQGTAILRVLERDTVVTVASEETSTDLKVTHRVGSSFPLARGAHGKVLAAYMPEQTVCSILRSQGIIKYTAKTIVGFENFMKHLNRVRLQGFGVDDEEVERGVRSLAAPVQDASGNVIASIGVSAPSFLIPKSKIISGARSVKQIAAELSAELGWSMKKASANNAIK